MGFGSSVRDWSEGTERQQTVWFQRSIELLAEAMNTPRPAGPLPHLTGNLMRSQRVTMNAPSAIGTSDNFAPIDVGLYTSAAKLTDVVYLNWIAAYAKRQNYGFVGTDKLGRVYNQTGAHFVEYGIAQWDDIKRRAWEEVEAVGA